MAKPKVSTKCPANAHAASDQRIVEFSFPGTKGPMGGLISFSVCSDGTPLVHVYRVDAGVRVSVSPGEG